MTKERELLLLDNTLKLLRKGKFELSGEEALVFHACFEYLVNRIKELKEVPAIKSEPVKKKVANAHK